VSVAPAKVALCVENVDIEPDVGVGEPVGSCSGVGKDLEGALGFAGLLGYQSQAPGGHPFPARIAELTGSCEGLQKNHRRAGRVGAG
jgi:hypothetical protein